MLHSKFKLSVKISDLSLNYWLVTNQSIIKYFHRWQRCENDTNREREFVWMTIIPRGRERERKRYRCATTYMTETHVLNFQYLHCKRISLNIRDQTNAMNMLSQWSLRYTLEKCNSSDDKKKNHHSISWVPYHSIWFHIFVWDLSRLNLCVIDISLTIFTSNSL